MVWATTNGRKQKSQKGKYFSKTHQGYYFYTAVLWVNYIFVIVGVHHTNLFRSKSRKKITRPMTDMQPKWRRNRKKTFKNNKFKFKCIKFWNLISINVRGWGVFEACCISNELVCVFFFEYFFSIRRTNFMRNLFSL